jgi:hypothetical protein
MTLVYHDPIINQLMCACSVEGINSHGINGIQIPKRNKFSVLPKETHYFIIWVFSFLAIILFGWVQ